MTLTADPKVTRQPLHTARFSTEPVTLDDLAHRDVPLEVLAAVACNSTTAVETLEHFVTRDERRLTYPVTRSTDLTGAVIDRIARKLDNRHVIYHAPSAPNPSGETLRYLADHQAAPDGTREQVTAHLDVAPVAA